MKSLRDAVSRRRSFFTPNDIFDPLNLPVSSGHERTWVPAFDVLETKRDYVVKAELPGMKVEDVDVTFSEGMLIIKGVKKQEREEDEERYHHVESCSGSFQRGFRLPQSILTDRVNATYKDGILRITLPKAGGKDYRKIQVR